MATCGPAVEDMCLLDGGTRCTPPPRRRRDDVRTHCPHMLVHPSRPAHIHHPIHAPRPSRSQDDVRAARRKHTASRTKAFSSTQPFGVGLDHHSPDAVGDRQVRYVLMRR